MGMPRLKAVSAVMLATALGLGGCKFIKTEDEQKAAAAGAFDPEKLVADIWNSKVLPYLDERAGAFQEVAALAASDLDAAAEKYGHKEKQGNAPWTFAAKVDGVIVAEETKSRAAYVDVDVDGDTKADVRVAIGPAIRGTAIRDSLDFVNFNEFKNQIEWAQYGKAFNTHVNKTLLEKLPRQGLTGKKVTATGAYPLPAKGQLPQFVPATITIGG
jgi:predicted lipoprotein